MSNTYDAEIEQLASIYAIDAATARSIFRECGGDIDRTMHRLESNPPPVVPPAGDEDQEEGSSSSFESSPSRMKRALEEIRLVLPDAQEAWCLQALEHSRGDVPHAIATLIDLEGLQTPAASSPAGIATTGSFGETATASARRDGGDDVVIESLKEHFPAATRQDLETAVSLTDGDLHQAALYLENVMELQRAPSVIVPPSAGPASATRPPPASGSPAGSPTLPEGSASWTSRLRNSVFPDSASSRRVTRPPGNDQTPLCPQGHPMSNGTLRCWTCDKCGKLGFTGDACMACRPCDYDICQKCFGGAIPTPAPEQSESNPGLSSGGGFNEEEGTFHGARVRDPEVLQLLSHVAQLEALRTRLASAGGNDAAVAKITEDLRPLQFLAMLAVMRDQNSAPPTDNDDEKIDPATFKFVAPDAVGGDDNCAVCSFPLIEAVTSDLGSVPQKLRKTFGNDDSAAVSCNACHNVFHAACLAKWVEGHNQCPLCRKSFLKE